MILSDCYCQTNFGLMHDGFFYRHFGGMYFEDNEPSKRLLKKLGFKEFTNHIINKRIIVDEIRVR